MSKLGRRLALSACLGAGLGAAAWAQDVRGPVHITANGVTDYAGQQIAFLDSHEDCDRDRLAAEAEAARKQALAGAEAAREIAREEARMAREEARRAAEEARQEIEEARAEAQAQRDDARDQLRDAQQQLFDAQRELQSMARDLARMEAGDFSDTLTIEDDSIIKCGDPARYPGCTPYTEAERAGMVAEMRQGLADGVRGVEEGQRGLAEAARRLAELHYP